MKRLLIVFGLALLFRLVFIAVWYQTGSGERLSSDSHFYYGMGRSLMEGRGFQFPGEPPARRPPLYCLFVGLVSQISPFPFGVYLAQAVLGAVSCLVLFALAREMFDDKVGMVASGLLAFDYAAVRFTVEVAAENLFVLLVLASFYHLYRYHRGQQTPSAFGSGGGPKGAAKACKKPGRNLWLSGIFAGLAVLTRDSLVHYFMAMGVWFFIDQDSRKACLSKFVAFLAAFIIVIGPWILRNSLIHKQFVMITTSSGHYLYLSNNETVKGQSSGAEWTFNNASYFPQDPSLNLPPPYTLEADRYFFKKAVEYIRAHPVRFLQLIKPKLIGMWRPYQADSPVYAKIAAAVTYIPVVTLGLIGLVQNLPRWRDFFPVYFLIAYIFLLHIVLHGVIRYRYPVMPFFMIFAAHVLVKTWERFNAERHKGVTIYASEG